MTFLHIGSFKTGKAKELIIENSLVTCNCDNSFFVPLVKIDVLTGDADFISCPACNKVGKVMLKWEK